MGRTVALDARSLEWVRRIFQSYYASTRIDPPSRIARREFAAFPFTEQTLMRRHASFRTEEAFREFLRREVPRHVYYSSAYYRVPEHPTMSAKEWLGADLIFDLDADHLRGAEKLDYAAQLVRVRDKVRDLVDDFLIADFGLRPDNFSLAFSGGRGYHVHVFEQSFLPLTSPERRELVDYIQGTGFDPVDAVQTVKDAERAPVTESVDGTLRPRSTRPLTFHRLFPPETPGWRGRTSRAFIRMLDRWESTGREAAALEMEHLGLSKADAGRLARSLIGDRKAERIREGLTLDVFAKEVPPALLKVLPRQAAVEVQGETDAPVTTDIHRLIRLPGSLHGGTGFRVVPLNRAELDRFDPFRDAVLPASNGTSAKVELTEAVDYPFGNPPLRGAAGELRELSVPQAAFLVLRGEAQLPPSPG